MSDIAEHCEAKKHAFRQTQDGVVVSFVLHPQEVPTGLSLAPLGTRYMLAVAEIGDDEQPKKFNPVAMDSTVIEKPKREPTLANKIGALCDKKGFQDFLVLHHREEFLDHTRSGGFADTSEIPKIAAAVVRDICKVKSRSEIVYDTPKADEWKNKIYEPYISWLEEQS